jgi:hypothetical protein
MHRNLVCQLISIAEKQGGIVEFDEIAKILRINGAVTIAVVIIPYQRSETDL